MLLVIFSVAVWLVAFSPCWIFSFAAPPARCISYFITK
jgi:hypothetical protein